MTGRLCRLFLCAERCLLTLYPTRDWSPVAERMRQWTAHSWDVGQERCWEAVPEYILEYPSFEETRREGYGGELTEEACQSVTACFRGLTDGDPADELCRVLKLPDDFVSACEGSGFLRAERETQPLIEKMQDILLRRGIPLLDMGRLRPFRFDRARRPKQGEPEPGWGGTAETAFLSEVLDR